MAPGTGIRASDIRGYPVIRGAGCPIGTALGHSCRAMGGYGSQELHGSRGEQFLQWSVRRGALRLRKRLQHPVALLW
jgi:hypothetical protein